MMNFFRYLADFSHLASKGILIATIHHRRSAEGVSLLTQALYTLVFVTRYLNIFAYAKPWEYGMYNFVFKVTYIATSFYIIFVMMRVFPRSREAEKQWKISAGILAFSLVASQIFYPIFRDKMQGWEWLEDFRIFSLILESLAVLPQLTLLAHTSIPTVITSYYLVALGSYRAVYILNWIWRGADPDDGFYDPVAVIFGIIQTLLYIEFFWIYWRRQKVKLRGGGGVLDGEEFARGLVLGRLIGREDGKPVSTARTGGGWRGSGGLSVSADDFVVGEGEDDGDSASGDEIEHEDDDDDLALEGDVERGLMSNRGL